MAQRSKAFEFFEKADYPDRGSEAWRHLPWKQVSLEAYPPAREVAGFTIKNEADLKGKGISFVSLQEGMRSDSDSELLQKYRSKIEMPEGKFEFLATAFANHGGFLFIPSVELAEPIILSWDGRISKETVFPHLLIVAQSNSRASVVLQLTSTDEEEAGMVFGVVEVLAERESQLSLLSIQEYGSSVNSFMTQKVRMEQGAEIQSILLGLGSHLAYSRLESALSAEGANAELLGFFFGQRDQHFNAHTLQDHQAPHTQSDLLFKSALSDQSSSAYYGLIRVEKGAQQTNACQANRNLLLGKGARAHSVPVLEISADDVRCTHGATVGPVDDEQKFYLMCRGLDQGTTEQLLLYGFFEHAIQRIRNEQLSQMVRDQLAERIGVEKEVMMLA